jgi:ABC-type transport system involved in cytochrome c biogenesis permease subunit
MTLILAFLALVGIIVLLADWAAEWLGKQYEKWTAE